MRKQEKTHVAQIDLIIKTVKTQVTLFQVILLYSIIVSYCCSLQYLSLKLLEQTANCFLSSMKICRRNLMDICIKYTPSKQAMTSILDTSSPNQISSLRQLQSIEEKSNACFDKQKVLKPISLYCHAKVPSHKLSSVVIYCWQYMTKEIPIQLLEIGF